MTGRTIGKAAREAGVSVETIRYYERRGLIARPPRPAGGGPRHYDRDTVQRIRFVREAQAIGFSLGEIAELLALGADPKADCADVRGRAIGKRDEVQAKLERLARMRDALDALIARCPGAGDVAACTILEAMRPGAGTDRMPMAGSAPDAPTEEADMKTTVLAVHGMHCEGCARTIEALLERVAGVRKVEASFDAGSVRILHDDGGVSEADLMKAVAQGGFEVDTDGA